MPRCDLLQRDACDWLKIRSVPSCVARATSNDGQVFRNVVLIIHAFSRVCLHKHFHILPSSPLIACQSSEPIANYTAPVFITPKSGNSGREGKNIPSV